MSMSLRDQLLAAGLGNKNQAKQAREDQHRNRHTQQHQQRKGQKPGAGGAGGRPLAPMPNVDPAKLARDQALEQKKRDKAARKERAAQVRQLVEPNALPRLETDDFYNFVHDGRIARVGVDAARRAALIGGSLVIVRSHGQYLVVSAEIAARVREREPRAVVHDAADGASSAGAPSSTLVEDDPYAQFKVPDDLVW
jgi:uncharacterized protein YaiL (DUF2058 family)